MPQYVQTEIEGDERWDVTVENHMSLFRFIPHSDAARTWMEEHCPDATWCGGLIVEHRYARDLAAQMLEEGFRVH